MPNMHLTHIIVFCVCPEPVLAKQPIQNTSLSVDGDYVMSAFAKWCASTICPLRAMNFESPVLLLCYLQPFGNMTALCTCCTLRYTGLGNATAKKVWRQVNAYPCGACCNGGDSLGTGGSSGRASINNRSLFRRSSMKMSLQSESPDFRD